MKAKELKNLGLPPESDPIDAGTEYRFLAEKPQFDTTTVAYCQTYLGLPVWQLGLAVHMKQAPFRIVSAQATLDPRSRPPNPPTGRSSPATATRPPRWQMRAVSAIC